MGKGEVTVRGEEVEERASEDRTELLCSYRTSLCCCEEIWIITKLAKHTSTQLVTIIKSSGSFNLIFVRSITPYLQ